MQNCKNLKGRGSEELLRTNIIDMLGRLMHKYAWVNSLTFPVFKVQASLSNTPSMAIFTCKFGQVLKVCKTLSTSGKQAWNYL